MNQRDEILAKINKASSLQEQAALVADLDHLDRMNVTAAADSRSIDLTDTIVRQTLQPVAVHERSTHETDWIGDIVATGSVNEAQKEITVEASMWFRRLSPEVRADSEEFAEQARGMARRTASAHGENAAGLEEHFLSYVAFLNQREGASGLPQVQQVVDSFENPGATPLPEDVFDTFAPPVHPINEGVTGTETSERNPLLQEIMGQGNGQGQPEKPGGHSTAPEPYTYAEVPPAAPQQMTGSHKTAGCSEYPEGAQNEDGTDEPVCEGRHLSIGDHTIHTIDNGLYRLHGPRGYIDSYESKGDAISVARENEDRRTASYSTPSVAISHSMNLDQFTAMQAEAASGLPQVEQVVDAQENPAPTPLPEDVAYPWVIDDEDPQAAQKREAYLRRAEHVARLSQQDPASLSDIDRREIMSFVASLGKQADQWTQGGEQFHGPGAANNPSTTPEPLAGSEAQGYAEGKTDWPGDAPTFADASSAAPDFARGHSQGYQDAARANPVPGAATPGQMPPGAGGVQEGYQTHTGSQKVASAAASVIDEGLLEKTSSLRVSAAFTSPVEHADPEFTKGYKYATKWTPRTRLVTTGSASFEAGLYAGMSDNIEHQGAWSEMHREAAAKFQKPEFLRRMSKHRSFSKQASRNLSGLKVVGAYLHPKGTSRTAASILDLDTMAPVTSPSPTGETPINGPGTPGPLQGGQDAAAPGGPSPYNGAEPFGAPVVPNNQTMHGQPTAISTIPGAPVDKAAHSHLSPQSLAFRRRVQSSLLQTRQGD